MKVLTWALLLVVVGVLVYTVIFVGPSEGIVGVVVGSTLSLLANVISRSLAAQEEQRKVEASRKLAKTEAVLRKREEIRSRLAQAYAESVEALSYATMWDRGSPAYTSGGYSPEGVAAARALATKSLSVIMLHRHGSPQSVDAFEKHYREHVAQPGHKHAESLLKAVIELHRLDDRLSPVEPGVPIG